jgi:hypothetical protein
MSKCLLTRIDSSLSKSLDRPMSKALETFLHTSAFSHFCTRQLLGVPQENTSSSQYTITARNLLGTSETTVNICVMTAPSLLSYGVAEIGLKPAQPVRYPVTYLQGISPISPFLPPSLTLSPSSSLSASLARDRTRMHARTHARTRARAHTHTHTLCTDRLGSDELQVRQAAAARPTPPFSG